MHLIFNFRKKLAYLALSDPILNNAVITECYIGLRVTFGVFFPRMFRKFLNRIYTRKIGLLYLCHQNSGRSGILIFWENQGPDQRDGGINIANLVEFE